MNMFLKTVLAQIANQLLGFWTETMSVEADVEWITPI